AVDAEDLAGDVTAGLGGEEHDRVGDVLGLAEPAQRIGALDALLALGRLLLSDAFLQLPQHLHAHGGAGGAGRYGVHVDVVPAHLLGDRFGEGDDPALGRGVVDLALLPDPRRVGHDIDDLAV